MLRQTVLKSTRQSLRTYATNTAAPPPMAPSKPVKKIGGFRGGFLGFFIGVSVTSLVTYTYVLEQHKTSSNVIISDVLTLQKSIRNLEGHVRVLERQQQQAAESDKSK